MVDVLEKLGQIDPNVSIPKEVLRSAAKSQEIYEKIYGKTEVSDAPPVDPPADPPQDPPAEVAVTPEVTPPADPPLTLELAPQPPKEPGANWEHAYKSMKGRFDRSQEQLASMGAQITDLQGLVASLQANPPAPKPSQAPKKLVTEDEERDYGVDLLGVVGKKAREEFMPVVSALEDQIKSLKSQLDGVNTQNSRSAADKMYDTLDREVPKWQELNNNPDFISWLGLPDPYSGVIRHELLKTAHERRSAPQVLAFFRGFLAEEAATAPALSVTPEIRAQEPPRAPKIPLESLAAPGRAKSAAADSAPTEKPIITRADIASFYADVNAGRYRGRDAEKNRIEVIINEADREGRIRDAVRMG